MRKSVLIILCCFSTLALADAGCEGRFINPLTDICWSCLFPMTLGSTPLYRGPNPDTKNPSNPLCVCTDGATPRVGLSVGFWEPARIAEVTRHPYCFVTLGGTLFQLPKFSGTGTVGLTDAQTQHSFYQVHWLVYPLLSWLNIIDDAVCVEMQGFDVMYVSELDPSWNDESLAFILNPEAVLFANPMAQAACAADCVAATHKLPLDKLYWCGGCHGSLYPFTGTVAAHTSVPQATALLTERLTYKLHRLGLAQGTMGKKALCHTYPMPLMKKSQYRLQMVYPKALTTSPKGCNPYGRSTALWGSGTVFPGKGEDVGYLIWRKRNCCAF